MPVERLVIIPEEEPIVPTLVLLLLHVPPVGVSLNPDVEPKHMFGAPLIVAGAGLMVIIAVEIQPADVT